MANVNDFLAFATSGGANVLSQSAYVALTSLISNGYQSGLAQSIQINKTLRQSSVIANMVAQFISDTLAADVHDDGNLAALLLQFKNAITAATAAAAAGTTQVVTTAQTVDASKNGRRYINNSAVTYTIAQANTLSTSFAVVIDTITAPATITVNAADYINGAGTPSGSVSIPLGRECRITTDGANHIFITYNSVISSVASAATIDLGAQTSKVITISGTTDITGFGATAVPGEIFTIIAGGSFNVVNGAGLVVPGGTIKTTVNDSFQVLCTTAGNYLVIAYSFIAGQRQTIGGQCRLTLSGTTLLLSPNGGNKIMINGVLTVIPDVGVTLAPTGLVASTVYYIYAYLNAGVLTLEASTTGYTALNGYGYMVKSTDQTRTLVGMACTTAATAWADSLTQRLVLSWYNRGVKRCDARLSSNITPAANANPISTDFTITFLTWAATDVTVGFMAEVGGVTSGIIIYTLLYLDGSNIAIAASNVVSGGQTADCNVNQRSYGGAASLAEGLHTLTLNNGSTSTGTYYANTYGTSMTYAEVQG